MLENEASSPRIGLEVAKGPKNKLHKIVDWVKSWSKRKERHQDHELQIHSSAGTPLAGSQVSPPEFERASRYAALVVPAISCYR